MSDSSTCPARPAAPESARADRPAERLGATGEHYGRTGFIPVVQVPRTAPGSAKNGAYSYAPEIVHEA